MHDDSNEQTMRMTVVPAMEDWPTAPMPKYAEDAASTGEHTAVGEPLEQTRRERFRQLAHRVGDFVMRRRGVAAIDFEEPFSSPEATSNLMTAERGDVDAFKFADVQLFTHNLDTAGSSPTEGYRAKQAQLAEEARAKAEAEHAKPEIVKTVQDMLSDDWVSRYKAKSEAAFQQIAAAETAEEHEWSHSREYTDAERRSSMTRSGEYPKVIMYAKDEEAKQLTQLVAEAPRLEQSTWFETQYIEKGTGKIMIDGFDGKLELPLNNIVSADTLTSWQGSETAGKHRNERVEPGHRTSGLPPSSASVIREYASRDTPIPPIDVVGYVQPNGLIFYTAENAHRAAAAKMRGDTTIGVHNLTLMTVDKNYFEMPVASTESADQAQLVAA